MEEQQGNENPQDIVTAKRKLGVKHKELYKSEIIKKARVKGEAYTSYKGKQVNKLQPGPDCT